MQPVTKDPRQILEVRDSVTVRETFTLASWGRHQWGAGQCSECHATSAAGLSVTPGLSARVTSELRAGAVVTAG